MLPTITQTLHYLPSLQNGWEMFTFKRLLTPMFDEYSHQISNKTGLQSVLNFRPSIRLLNKFAIQACLHKRVFFCLTSEIEWSCSSFHSPL